MSKQISTQEPAFLASLSVSEVSHFAENIDTFRGAADWIRNYLAARIPNWAERVRFAHSLNPLL